MILKTAVLAFLAAEILAGLFMALRTRDTLHWQIVSFRWLTWKSRTIPIEQELADMRLIGITLAVCGAAAVLCILNMDALVTLMVGGK